MADFLEAYLGGLSASRRGQGREERQRAKGEGAGLRRKGGRVRVLHGGLLAGDGSLRC